jgi:hypothetical protein
MDVSSLLLYGVILVGIVLFFVVLLILLIVKLTRGRSGPAWRSGSPNDNWRSGSPDSGPSGSRLGGN